jgi:hypothetical protein
MIKATKNCFAVAFGVGTAMMTVSASEQQRFGEFLAQADIEQQRNNSLLRGNNLAPTGETVPHPGSSQIGDESAQERGAQKKSDEDTRSICSNCE